MNLRRGIVLLAILLAAGCNRPSTPAISLRPGQATVARLDSLDQDVLPLLRQLPGVVRVTRDHVPKVVECRLLHLLDWHYVDRELFSQDMQDQSDEEINQAEMGLLYAAFLEEVEQLQSEQMTVLEALVDQHVIRELWLEGLTAEDEEFFRLRVAALAKIDSDLLALRETLKGVEPPAELAEAEEQHRRDLLQVGAAGRLLMRGKVDRVRGLEDAEAFTAADPLISGRFVFDQQSNEAREDAQLKRLKNSGTAVQVVILGRGHDYADNLKRRPGQSVEYFRLSTPSHESPDFK